MAGKAACFTDHDRPGDVVQLAGCCGVDALLLFAGGICPEDLNDPSLKGVGTVFKICGGSGWLLCRDIVGNLSCRLDRCKPLLPHSWERLRVEIVES